MNLTPEDLQKERNKRNAKKSRKKKKEYVETLEKRLADVEQELAKTQSELAKYKTREHLYQTGNYSGYEELMKCKDMLKTNGTEVIEDIKNFPQNFISQVSKK